MRADRDRHNFILLAAALAFMLSVSAIAVAWGFQLFGGYLPCELCLEQRTPYYIAIPFAAVAAVCAARRWTRLARYCLLVTAVVILYSAGIGIYQAGAEWRWWEGPSSCGAGAQLRDAGAMLETLQNTRIVSCTEASFRFLGLSFAGWNAAAALTIAALALAGAVAGPHRGRDPDDGAEKNGAGHEGGSGSRGRDGPERADAGDGETDAGGNR